jgi:hypothetical protein
MTTSNQTSLEEAAQRGEAIAANALAKADRLLGKTTTLRHQVNRLKDELAEEIATAEPKNGLLNNKQYYTLWT